MKKKVELILIKLIKIYLNRREPISSTLLKELTNIDMSPSTIRGYFQNLEKMGLIEKEHFSSGSYPSAKAMEFFWKQYFPNTINISFKEFKKKCEKLDIGAFIKIFENQMLNEIYNVNNKFIVLEFENNELVIKYDENVFNLLKSFKFLNSKDLIKIFEYYNLLNIVEKIKNFQRNYLINRKLLYNKFNQFNFDFLNEVDDLYINKDKKILIKKYLLFEDQKEIEIYLMGNIYSNFLVLFESMKGGENEEEKEKRN